MRSTGHRNGWRLVAILGSLLGGATLLAAPGAAQQRPSLEALTRALCAKADRDGDTHRPEVCDARCDCLDGVDLSGYGTCQQTTPGEYRILSSDAQDWGGSCGVAATCVTPPSLDPVSICTGSSYTTCSTSSNCPSGELCFGSSGLCSISGDPCGADYECPSGESCVLPSGSCLDPCSVDSDCTDPEPLCSASSRTACTTDAQCTQPEHCVAFYQECGRSCSADSDCGLVGSADRTVLTGVDAADPAAPATCDPPSGTATSISSKDAGACVASIETVTGPCTGP